MRDLSKLKICFLAGTLEHGGAERQLFYMLQALCRCGAAPRVLCLDQGEFWEKPIQSLGVPVTFVGRRPSRLARLFHILREMRKDLPDVFQSQHFFANAYVGLAGRLLQRSGIGAIRNEGHSEVLMNGPVGGWLNLHLPKILAANSRLGIEHARARGVSASRLFFLPNVIDTQMFQPSSGPTDGPVTLLAVGRVAKQKRFDRFVTILSRLRRDLNLPVRGLIVGPVQDESLYQELQRQAMDLGIMPDGLEFLGGRSEMASLYQKAAVCVLTSDYEGTPNALLEAMACGLPVVSTKVGGVPQIVRDGKTGFVFEREDLDGFVKALAELIRNHAMRMEMGCRAREYVQENHSLKLLPEFLGKLYEVALPKDQCPMTNVQLNPNDQ